MTAKRTGEAGDAAIDFQSFFELSTDLLCIAGFDGYFKVVNPAWEHTLGWSVAELTASPWSEFVHPDDLECTIAEAKKQTDAGLDAIQFENRYRTKDGSYRWLLWNSRPCPERQEMLAVARDVTAQHEAQQALIALNVSLEHQVAERTAAAEERAEQAEGARQSLQQTMEQVRIGADRWRAFLQQMPLASALIDVNMRCLFASDRFMEDFDLADKDVLSTRLTDIFKESDRWHDILASCLAGERQERSEELFALRDGRQEWVRWRADPWRPPAGVDVQGMVLYTEIITSRKESEARLRASAADLSRSNSELEAFTYSVSHDLKEPLRTIEAFSQFLLEDYKDKLDEQGQDYLQKLATASARMKQLIEDLLALSRIGRRDDPTSKVDVGRLVGGVVEGLRVMIGERSVHIAVEQGLPDVRGDAARLEQIFGNLITNGIKFNRSAIPSIKVGVRESDDSSVTFYVADNGIGIDPAYHERIFGIFQRLHRREEFEGTGAGLAIVKRAVESLGGAVSVESDGASGSTFVFSLPAVGSDSNSAMAA
jgi:PAS domain S-box-containing protein